VRRPVDLLLVLFFAFSVLYGLLFSLPEGLGMAVSADSPWPPLRWLYGWAAAQEAAHLDPPIQLIASCLFDGLFQAPMGMAIVYGLVRPGRWLLPVSWVYAGAAVTNMFFYFFETFRGPHPPDNLAVYLPLNLPWLAVPVVVALRARVLAPPREA